MSIAASNDIGNKLVRITITITKTQYKTNMTTKEQKQQVVAELVEKIKRSSGIYFIDFTGMDATYTLSTRRELKSKGIEFRVAKNTVILRALAEVGGYEHITREVLFGQTMLWFGVNDGVGPAKVLKELTEKSEIPKLKAAYVEGEYFDSTQLKALASLPTREDLIAGILGSLNAPISGIVGSVNAVLRDVAYLVEEVAKKQNAA